jgi:predicted nucleic acid-binding protein
MIAATALSHGLALCTQDADFHDFADLDVIRI